MRDKKTKKRRGSVLVWVAILLPVLIAFVGMAVDVGRIFVANANLQAFADVASLSGALYLPDTTAADGAARTILSTNDASAGAALEAGDIEFGNWDPQTRTYTPGGTPLDAIRVVASHDDAHENPLPLFFLPIIGHQFADVQVAAISFSAPRVGGHYSGGLIGIEWVDITGTSFIDGYDINDGPYGPDNSGLPGTVLSNGTVTVRGTPHVSGDARPGVSYTEATVRGNATVEGTTAALTKPLDFASVEIPTSITDSNNNNSAITGVIDDSGDSFEPVQAGDFYTGPGQTATIPGGDYYFNEFDVRGTVNITGPATIRVTGDLHINAGDSVVNIVDGLVEFYIEGDGRLNGQGFVNQSQDPRNLVIYSTGDSLTWNGGSDFHGYLYGPDDTIITINGDADFYGGAVGRALELSGTGNIHTENGEGFDGPNRRLPILVD